VRFALEKAGYRVTEAGDGRAALAEWARAAADLVVLDVLMPELDGLDVCRELRSQSSVPILFLSSRDEDVDKIVGLELGADDYVTKPFSPRELVARVKGILRRTTRPPEHTQTTARVVVRGAIELDLDRNSCRYATHTISLTVTEFDLLHSLCGMPGKVYSRDELVERAYGGGHHITDRTVDSHIRRIRQKFGVHDFDPIETVRGRGYRLRESVA